MSKKDFIIFFGIILIILTIFVPYGIYDGTKYRNISYGLIFNIPYNMQIVMGQWIIPIIVVICIGFIILKFIFNEKSKD